MRGSSRAHPFAVWQDVALGGGDRRAEVDDTVRELAHREPTFAARQRARAADVGGPPGLVAALADLLRPSSAGHDRMPA